MKNYVFAFLFLLFALCGYSQEFKGRIYGQDAPVEDALIQNKTQKISVNTDAHGDFAIKANVGDSIAFSAAFYVGQILEIKQEQLKEPWVIELKSNLNRLNEVTVTKAKDEDKAFDIKEYNAQLNADIKTDMENNPGRYSGSPSGGMDFVKIGGLIANLFKKKNNKNKITEITYEQLTTLLKKDDLINDQLLIERLNIPKNYHDLFVDYCIKKGIDSKLLAADSRFQLLDTLVKYNDEFQKVLADYKASSG